MDNIPLLRVYKPELCGSLRNPISVKKIIRLKGRRSSAVASLKETINSANWANAWICLLLQTIDGLKFLTFTGENRNARSHKLYIMDVEVNQVLPFVRVYSLVIVSLLSFIVK